MEWLDYADCAGDDPLKWDLDHVEVDDVQAYARKVCADCPVKRECADSAIPKHEIGKIFNRVVASANLANAESVRVEPEREAVARQYGVIRGGVALVGQYETLLYAVAGAEWNGLKDCLDCGRVVYRSDKVPVADRPEGSVSVVRHGMCSTCAYGPPAVRKAGLPTRVAEAAELRRLGFKAREVAERMGVAVRTVDRYWSLARGQT